MISFKYVSLILSNCDENAEVGSPHHGFIPWLPTVRMLIVSLIAFGYMSTMPRGPDQAEYLRVFAYDPSWYGISLIFMISGYLTMRSLQRHNSGLKMLLSRIGRNLPILVIFALSVIFVIYPLFSDPQAAVRLGASQKIDYFLKVVSCFNPDTLTPGLLDNALYTCLINGGLWTFSWGVIAFIASAIGWHMGVLKNLKFVAFLAVLMVVIYGALVSYVSKTPDTNIGFLVTGTRMAWPFLIGLSVYNIREKLPRTWLLPGALFAIAGVQFAFMSWTPCIEIIFTLCLGYLVFLAMTSTVKVPTFLKHMPDLSLGLYVFNWPVAQLTLLLLPAISPLALFGVSFPITTLIAFGLWRGIKRPIKSNLDTFTAVRALS